MHEHAYGKIDESFFSQPARETRALMDEHAQDTSASPVPEGPDAPASNAKTPNMGAAEYAKAFGKAVDVAEKVLRFAPLPPGAKRVAVKAMPTVKKVAKVAPIVAPIIEPYAQKAAEQAKIVAPKVADAAKTGAKNAATGVQAGAKAAASGAKKAAVHVRETAPKAGHAVADGAKAATARVQNDVPKLGRAAAEKASNLSEKLKRKKKSR